MWRSARLRYVRDPFEDEHHQHSTTSCFPLFVPYLLDGKTAGISLEFF